MVSAMTTFGRSVTASSARKVRFERGDVVTVHPTHVPPERTKLRFEIAEAADVLDPGIRLDLVVVNDGDDLGETACRRRAERFPELPFLQFAVARQHEYASRRACLTVGDRHPFGFRNAHPERAGVCLDEWRLDVRMPRQPVQPSQLVQLVSR